MIVCFPKCGSLCTVIFYVLCILQVALAFECHCTQMAVVPYYVDIVDVGKMSLQSTVMSKSFPAHCARVPLKFVRFNNFRIENLLDYGQVDRGR